MNITMSSYLSSVFMLGWRDLVELLCCILFVYRISVWLNRDKIHTLLWYVYGYCCLVMASYYVELNLLYIGLVTYAPVIATLCIFMHQDTLAKYLRTPYKIVPARLGYTWHDELIQACLIAMNNRKQVVGIIEHNENLDTLLTTPYAINSQLHKNILVLLFNSSLYEQNSLIWLSSTGLLKGINCTWTPVDTGHSQWETTVRVSMHNNVVAFRCNPDTNSFDIAIQGNLIEHISSSSFRSILVEYLHKNSPDSATKQCKSFKKEDQKYEKISH